MRTAARSIRLMLMATLAFGGALGCSTRSRLRLTDAGTQLRTPAQSIVVRDFGCLEGVPVPADIFKAVTAAITARLARSGKFRDSQVYARNPKADVAGIEVDGIYTRFTEGSELGRFVSIPSGWAGKARMEAEIRIVDRKTKQVLASAQVRTSTTWGGFTGLFTTVKDLVEPFAKETVGLVGEYKGESGR